jgi:hypothetical protein
MDDKDMITVEEASVKWQRSERAIQRITKEEIKQRSLRMAVTTGVMPSVDLIWKIQQQEQHQTCFGQGQGCLQRDCYWRHQCLALDSFADTVSMSDL